LKKSDWYEYFVFSNILSNIVFILTAGLKYVGGTELPDKEKDVPETKSNDQLGVVDVPS
jgi:hypothetical protein